MCVDDEDCPLQEGRPCSDIVHDFCGGLHCNSPTWTQKSSLNLTNEASVWCRSKTDKSEVIGLHRTRTLALLECFVSPYSWFHWRVIGVVHTLFFHSQGWTNATTNSRYHAIVVTVQRLPFYCASSLLTIILCREEPHFWVRLICG
jgi:hypothetical protein